MVWFFFFLIFKDRGIKLITKQYSSGPVHTWSAESSPFKFMPHWGVCRGCPACAPKPPSRPPWGLPFATSPVAMSPASTPAGSHPHMVLRGLCPIAGGFLPASQPRDWRSHEATIPYLCPNWPSSIDFPFARRTLLPSRAGSDLFSPLSTSDRKEIKNK